MKNGKDLASEEFNGLVLVVEKLNLRKLLINFESQIHLLQNWGKGIYLEFSCTLIPTMNEVDLVKV